MISLMDQGVAAVWAAGLGIAGTLLGALGGSLVQARATRKQVIHQEEADVRLRIRDERRAAYSAVLDHYDRAKRAVGEVMQYRTDHDAPSSGVPEDLRKTEREAVEDLQRAVMDVTIAGPPRMASLAERVLAAEWSLVIAVTDGRLDYQERVRGYNNALDEGRDARRHFVEEAHRVLAVPDREM
jgi:hypothetical protein